jgi:signal transduction histidine kinase
MPAPTRPILYIEDDADGVALVRRILENSGHVVMAATTGMAGIEAALREHPLLILLDISLPDLDGYAVVGIMRTFPTLAAIPVVAVTAYAVGPGDRDRTLIAGCDGYINKPIDIDRFPGQVAEYLAGKREFATATDLRKLQEQFVANLLTQLDDVTKLKQSLDRRAAGLERIDQAVDELSAATGVLRLLETLLPRLADAIGADVLAVELDEPAGQRVTGRARTAPADTGDTSRFVERRRPLDFGGRSLGVVAAFYDSGEPTVDDAALLNVVAHQLALAVENARLYEHEQRLRSEAEALDRRKDYFLAVLAHELRAPLAPILSAMQLIGRPQTNPELLRTAREVVERQVRYQAGLLDDLLDLTRIDRDKIELRLRVVDVRDIVGAAVEVTRPVIELRRQHLVVGLPDDAVMVTVDAVRVEQVVINLLGNAAKYTSMNGDIAVTAAAVGEHAVLTVSDSGEGISVTMLERVFDPFVQVGATEGRPRPAGLGIGLALTRRLVELHGGTVEARSAGIDKGSEFIVRLPLAAGAIAPMTSEQPTPGREPADVLLVEDDADTRDMLRLALEEVGHRVSVAQTGSEAIERAATAKPEVMLVDLGLPDIHGHEVARRVRGALGGSVFLVALTGFGQPEDVRATETAGFNAHLLKPATIDDITRVLAGRPHAAGAT